MKPKPATPKAVRMWIPQYERCKATCENGDMPGSPHLCGRKRGHKGRHKCRKLDKRFNDQCKHEWGQPVKKGAKQ